MAHFTNPRYLNTQDGFLDSTNFDQNDWDDPGFDMDDDTWEQEGIEDLDLDDLDDFDEEDQDDFNGVF